MKVCICQLLDDKSDLKGWSHFLDIVKGIISEVESRMLK